MTIKNLPFGTKTAPELRHTSSDGAIAPTAPRTVGDLLEAWNSDPPKEIKMLRSTCGVLSTFLESPAEQLSISEVKASRPNLRSFLEGRKYAENSVRTYVNHVRILLKYAKRMGWQEDAEFPKAWYPVLLSARKKECGDLAKSLIPLRKSPSDVTLEDVDTWAESAMIAGLSVERARNKKRWFWQVMHDCGYTDCVPLSMVREKAYGIPLGKFPVNLKTEVLSLLEWKQAEYAVDRPKDARHRPVTVKRLREVISELYGFAVSVRGELHIDTFFDLVQRPIVSHFVMWCINERKVKGQSLERSLRLVRAVCTQHPSYRSVDFSWFKPLLDGLPVERDSEIRERKAAKFLEYSVLEAIPTKIKSERTFAAKKGAEHVSRVVMEELLLKWLTVLPWRQKNIRQCRISGLKPNLFKAKIPPFSTLAKPEWVEAEERRNPKAEFWQFKFSHLETKMKNDVHALLPLQLVGLLEEYLQDYRPNLLREGDPGTLFLNRAGKPLDSNEVNKAVSKRTLQYGGRRVTPHIFRDIIAFTWLSVHPQDYLTVSKLLWHTSINTTLRVYGSRFNESSAVCRMESWLEEREKG